MTGNLVDQKSYPNVPKPEDQTSHPTSRKYRKHQFFSQAGQDKYFLDHFPWMEKLGGGGFFVEFGARDGVVHSNTNFFARTLGWQGILVEASPREHQDIVKNRPEAAIVNGAVCETSGTVTFRESIIGGMNGFVDTYDSARKQRSLHGQDVTVQCYPLSMLTGMFGVKHINLMTVDTEGNELQALKSFDWDGVTVDVIFVEALVGKKDDPQDERTLKQQDIITYMESVNYRLYHVFQFPNGVIDTVDMVFVPNSNQVSDRSIAGVDQAHFDAAKKSCIRSSMCLGAGGSFANGHNFPRPSS
jgi:FkbM family methyltransferase